MRVVWVVMWKRVSLSNLPHPAMWVWVWRTPGTVYTWDIVKMCVYTYAKQKNYRVSCTGKNVRRWWSGLCAPSCCVCVCVECTSDSMQLRYENVRLQLWRSGVSAWCLHGVPQPREPLRQWVIVPPCCGKSQGSCNGRANRQVWLLWVNPPPCNLALTN